MEKGLFAKICPLAGLLMVAALDAAQAPRPVLSAAQQISRAIDAMGGEARLSGIKSLTLETIGHQWALEQSERPEGPWLAMYRQTSEIRDFENHRRSVESQVRTWFRRQWGQLSAIVTTDDIAAATSNQRWVARTASDVQASKAEIALTPERLLFTARAAADLVVLPDEVHQKVPQHVLGFTSGGQGVRIFLNAWTHLPTMLEVTKRATVSAWGDVTLRYWFSYWTLEATGFLYPRQTTVEWNGYPYQDTTIHSLTVNAPIDPAKFAIPDDVKAAYAAALQKPATDPFPFDAARAKDVNDWIVRLPSGFNVELIKQPDGIVIIEAVGLSSYSAAVLDFVKTRFPGAPVKALITTADAWPHIGGVREYVARGIPIYALDLNVPLLTRNVKSRFTAAPDSLSKTPRAPIFRPVSARTVIGTGESRIELIPVRGESGERMMLAWLPGAKMLYASDLIQPNPPNSAHPFAWMAMPAEVEAVVAREKLMSVETVFGMHLAPTPWTSVTTAIREAGAKAAAVSIDLPASATPQQHLARAMAAMGGEARLGSLKSLSLETIGHNWAIEQSERPEGPWLSTYVDGTDIRDFEHDRRRTESRRRNWSSPKWSVGAVTVINGLISARTDGGSRWLPGTAADIKSIRDVYALSPEKLLFTARSGSQLRVLPDEKQQGVNQNVVGFTLNGQPMRLFLNAWTGLPTMLEITRKETRFAPWGDVKERRWYSWWTLEDGLMYPRQTSTEWNGVAFSDETVLEIKVDGAVDDAKLAIPDDTKAAFTVNATKPAAPVPPLFDATKAIAISDWLVELPAGYNVSVVRQPDGLVIFEATTSNAHADAVMAFAASRFPGVPIKAVVTTSDAWPHIAGLRAYAAKGIPIYALDLNVSILKRFVAAPHTLDPDALSQRPKAPIFRPVSARTVIGSGDTRVELIAVRGETGERMMMAWFPSLKALYTSDLIQRASRPTPTAPFFNPEMLMEVQTAAEREGITGIERVFGMHLAPTPWSEVLAAIAAAKGQ